MVPHGAFWISHVEDDMKALLYDKDGSRESLEIREIAKPAPKKNEVLVGVHAVSIKDWDWGSFRTRASPV